MGVQPQYSAGYQPDCIGGQSAHERGGGLTRFGRGRGGDPARLERVHDDGQAHPEPVRGGDPIDLEPAHDGGHCWNSHSGD